MDDNDLKLFEEKANKGDIEAQNALGKFYLDEFDLNKSKYWYEKAAMQGNAIAQYKLGNSYVVASKYDEAMKWYTQAAKQGNTDAQYSLASIYEEGKCTVKDYIKAAYWYESASKLGDPLAQICLGLIYRDGKGISVDNEKAIILFEKAANNIKANIKIKAEAEALIANLYECDDWEKHDYLKAMEWYKKATKHRDTLDNEDDLDYLDERRLEEIESIAAAHLELFYTKGLGVEPNYAKAKYWRAKKMGLIV